MINKVNAYIVQHQLIEPGDNILAACSGGADSLALVDILQKLSCTMNFQLAVAHVDHMFRGEESAADAQFVKEFCRERALPCYITAINVPKYLSVAGGSTEDASRKLRYQYLREVARVWGNAKIATGHHRDDQAETVLLHLFRGAGGSGLSGMEPKTGDIIRPLLVLTRKETEQYCHRCALKPRLDSTNLEHTYLRNRIRLEIIPCLERELGFSVREPLCRTAQIVADQNEFLDTVVEAIWPSLAGELDGEVSVSTEKLNQQHIAVKRLVFRKLIEKIKGNLTGITFLHVEKLIEMSDCWPVGSKLDLPEGWRAERGYKTVAFSRRMNEPDSSVRHNNVVLTIPGETNIPEFGIRVLAVVHDNVPKTLQPTDAVFDLAVLQQPLYVRSRLPGDRISPRGMQGEKKVKDVLIDKKIPRKLRDQVPVFCDRQGTIIWLGGLRTARYGQISEQTTEYLSLQIIRLQEELYEHDGCYSGNTD